MIDTHAHINTDEFAEDRDEMLRNAFHSGVEAVIIPATKPDEFDEIINLAQSRPELFCAIGVHPHHAAEIAPKDLDTVALRSSENKIVAIGEIGLDYYYDFSPKDIQQEVFRRQLRIAKETGLPAIIHNRESDDDLIRIIRDEQDGRLRGVLHCFSSPVGALREALDLGMHVSFTGNITFKNTDLAEQVTAAPLERIMIETDSPYMTPVPFRGRRNDPSRVGLVAEKIAEYKNISIDEVLEMTTKTAKKFFNLVIMLIMLALPSIAIAQDEGYQDDYYYDEGDEYYQDEDIPEEQLVHPYPKLFGFGGVLGFNTIVQELKLPGVANAKPASYDGLLAYGGTISAEVWDYLMLEATYIYSKNTKIAEFYNYLVDPSTHQIVELGGRWIANPYNKVSFYAHTGMSLIFNSTNNGNTERLGLDIGLGANINIPLSGNAGMLVPYFEWRVDYEFGESEILIPVGGEMVIATTTQFFSVPRVGVIWFPEFLR